MAYTRDRWLYPVFIKGEDIFGDDADTFEFRAGYGGAYINTTLPKTGNYYLAYDLPEGFPGYSLFEELNGLVQDKFNRDITFEYASPQNYTSPQYPSIDNGALRFLSTQIIYLRFQYDSNLSRALGGIAEDLGLPYQGGGGAYQAQPTIPRSMPLTPYGMWTPDKPASDKRRNMEHRIISAGIGRYGYQNMWNEEKSRTIEYRNIPAKFVRKYPYRRNPEWLDPAERFHGVLDLDFNNAFQDMWEAMQKGPAILIHGGQETTEASLSNLEYEIVRLAPENMRSFASCVEDFGAGEHYNIKFKVQVEDWGAAL